MIVFSDNQQPLKVQPAQGRGGATAVLRLFVVVAALAASASHALASAPVAASAEAPQQSPQAQTQLAPGQQVGSLYIREYRIDGGSNLLPRIQIEEAVYPFLGPGRTENDVEQARAALEKAFRDKGYQTVAVQIPQQQVRRGVVVLQVVEGKVGRLRVKGSRYFLPSDVKKGSPSMAEGTVPDFNRVTHDIVALNQNPDRRVTPVLRAGMTPGTVDIDLNVQDSLPVHASLELNNRYSPNTTPLRLDGSVSYDNLWQLGQKIGASFQIAPERLSDSEVFTGYYIAPIPNVSWLSLMAQGTEQNSDVATLGGLASLGNGTIIGARALVSLVPGKDYYHSFSFGMDYKHFLPTNDFTGPITYYPWSFNYSLTLTGSGAVTEMNIGVNLNFRPLGNSPAQFNDRRLLDTGTSGNSNKSGDGSYLYLRGDLSHTHELPGGFQLFGKVQAQLADQQLVDTEQYSGGGFATARGYLESTVTADNAIFGTAEVRTPSLGPLLGKAVNNWRFYAFSDNGYLWLYNTDPGQAASFTMASVGVGSRAQLFDHLNGEVVLGIPLLREEEGLSNVPSYLITFRVWGEF